jgi:uncharacterized damage-inducible protein DinB
MTPEYFQYFAKYNSWANKKLFDACGQLSSEEYFKQRPSSFGSIHRTLNHIMVADRIWLDRFAERETLIKRLDHELFNTLEDLRTGRRDLDRAIEEMTVELNDLQLTKELSFRLLSKANETSSSPMRYALGHFFNHQTHHRGQVHDLLSQTAVPPPSLDLIYFVRELREPK